MTETAIEAIKKINCDFSEDEVRHCNDEYDENLEETPFTGNAPTLSLQRAKYILKVR